MKHKTNLSKIIYASNIRKGMKRIWNDGKSKHRRQSELAIFLKEELEKSKNIIKAKFDVLEFSGMNVVHAISYVTDIIIAEFYKFTFDEIYNLPVDKKEHISIVAVGGYGREELAPYSDIDIMFLLLNEDTKQDTEIISLFEFILYVLWDMKLKLGHSIRTIDECIDDASDDMTIRTAFLSARNVCGSNCLTDFFKVKYKENFFPRNPSECHEFVEAKLQERNERHERMGKSRYVLEPDVKDGRGCLRDLHTLFWMAQYLYGVKKISDLTAFGIIRQSAMQKFKKNYNFLMTVRCCLHYLAGRDDNRLTFDVQQSVAKALRYSNRAKIKGVERFMKHFYLVAKDTGGLTRVICSVLEEQKRSKPLKPLAVVEMLMAKKTIEGFTLKNGRLNILLAKELTKNPSNIIKIFWASHRHNISIHNEALKLIAENVQVVKKVREDEIANKLFLEILTSHKNPEKTLRHMNEARVLGAFIPEFAKVVAQMQYDTYHVYTTDEHTIRAISILHHIEHEISSMKHEEGIDYDFSIPNRVASYIQSRKALYVALFLHDIGKGQNMPHSEVGEKIALKLCPRFGLSQAETETVAWLIKNHLFMSNTAFSRDVYDRQTITEFAGEVKSLERLRLLFVLTCADICAVGPGTWSGWKATLLYELFIHAKDALLGGLSTNIGDARVEEVKIQVQKRLKRRKTWDEDDIEWFLGLGAPSYWLTYPINTILLHATLLYKSQKSKNDNNKVRMSSFLSDDEKLTEITVYTHDEHALFSKLTGAIAMSGGSILSAKINTLNNGMALDTFAVQAYIDGANVLTEGVAFEKTKILKNNIEKALKDSENIKDAVKQKTKQYKPKGRRKVFEIATRVIAYNSISKDHTVIEINGSDRPGLLYYVSNVLSEMGLQISSAHINTFGLRVVDVFYVRDKYGMKIQNKHVIDSISRKIQKVLEDF